jgi:hypothetical protein
LFRFGRGAQYFQIEVIPMPPAPPKLAPDTLTEAAQPVWQRSDWFRAFLFGSLAAVYGVLLFPLAVVALAFWVMGKALGSEATDNESGTVAT